MKTLLLSFLVIGFLASEAWLLIFPGTKWCGLGNKAANYNDLGKFRKTDKCCRGHDKCFPEILPFRAKYGIWNARHYTLKGCKCEKAFKKCLRKIGSSASKTLYHIYFKVLRPKCLKKKRGCVKRRWFKCVKYGKRYYVGK